MAVDTAKYKRIAIVGGPKTGKTTYARTITDRQVIHGDNYLNLAWSKQSQALVDVTRDLESFVVEGTAVARALRKGMVVDAVIVMSAPYETRNMGQRRMAAGVATVFANWRKANPGVPVVNL